MRIEGEEAEKQKWLSIETTEEKELLLLTKERRTLERQAEEKERRRKFHLCLGRQEQVQTDYTRYSWRDAQKSEEKKKERGKSLACRFV